MGAFCPLVKLDSEAHKSSDKPAASACIIWPPNCSCARNEARAPIAGDDCKIRLDLSRFRLILADRFGRIIRTLRVCKSGSQVDALHGAEFNFQLLL